MADQQKPNPVPAPKKSANLGQRLKAMVGDKSSKSSKKPTKQSVIQGLKQISASQSSEEKNPQQAMANDESEDKTKKKEIENAEDKENIKGDNEENKGAKEQAGEQESTSEEPEGYNPYVSPETKLGPDINTPSFKSDSLGAQQRAFAAVQAPTMAPAENEVAGEEESETDQPGGEEKPKFSEEDVLKGAGLETGPSIQEQIRDELLKERAIAAAKESAGEQVEEEDQQQAINATAQSTLPTPAKLNSDRILDAAIVSVLATKDLADLFDYIGFGTLSAAFFLVIVMVLRKMQKTRTNKSLAMIFGIILFLDAIPVVAMLFPSSVVMLYFLRFEDMQNKLKTIPGPIKSDK